MALRFIFDRVENARIRNTVDGTEYVRRVTVVDIPVEAAGSGHMAMVRILTDPQCPQLNTAFPAPSTGALLKERNLVALQTPKRRVEMELVYFAVLDPSSGGGGQIVWTVQDGPIVNHVLTNMTSNQGATLTVWYKPGESTSTTTFPSGASLKGIQTHKVQCDRQLRVTGRASKAQWTAIRNDIRAAAGKINSVLWGGYPRGDWLFLGPLTSTIDRGNNFDISLEFWWKRGGHYTIGFYTDEFGNIPSDITSEATLRTGGPPPEGTYKGRNGVMMGSVQIETNFNALFTFTPDEVP